MVSMIWQEMYGSGVKINTEPDIVVKSLIKMLLKDPDQLEVL